MIPTRWTAIFKQTQGSTQNIEDILVVDSECVKMLKKLKVLSSEDRYNKAMSICTDICALVSSCGGNQYQTRSNALKSMRTLLRRGTEVTVVGLDGNNRPKGKVLVHSLLRVLFIPFLT